MAKQQEDTVTIIADATATMLDESAKVMGQKTKTFTEDDVESIRKQEKDKMYKRLEESDTRTKILEEQLKVISGEREVSIKKAEEATAKESTIRKQREFEELSAKELLLKQETEFTKKINDVEAEWQGRLAEIEADRQTQSALLDKERRHQELQNYINRRMKEEQEFIIPQLLPLIRGSSEEEIELWISQYKDASSAILENVQRVQSESQTRFKAVGVTSPPVGPMETQMEQQTLTAEDIRNMSMEQYQKMREKILNARSSKGRF